MQTRGKRIARRLAVVWAAAVMLTLTMVSPSLGARAAAGYYYGKITVVDEPDTFSTENVTYYIGEEAASADAIEWVDGGHTGKAIRLSGNGEYLRLGYTAARPREFTFSGWINWQGAVDEQTAAGQRLFTIYRDGTHYLTLSPYMQDAGMTANGGALNGIYLGYRYGSTTVNMFNPTSGGVTYALPCNEWHHLAVVSDGRTIKLYIDGVRWLEQQVLTTMAELSGSFLKIGAGEWGDPTLNALLDDVTLYNSAFSESRIAELAGGSSQTPVYIPTQPDNTGDGTVSTTAAPTAADTTATTVPVTQSPTILGVPLWGIYIILGVVAVYVVLVVVLNVKKRGQG